MKDEFTLSVNYKGQEHYFNARLIVQGYAQKFQIKVNETEVYFEPDEEGNYRAVKMPWQELILHCCKLSSKKLNLYLHDIGAYNSPINCSTICIPVPALFAPISMGV